MMSSDEIAFDQVLGDANAAQHVVAYESFTCPLCKEFMAQSYPKLKSEFIATHKVRYALREVYLDEAGLMAATMLRALPKEQYFPTVEKLYDQQADWSTGVSLADVADSLLQIGRSNGASERDIIKNMSDEQLVRKLVQSSERHIAEDQVENTPTIFVNDKRVQDWRFKSLSDRIGLG